MKILEKTEIKVLFLFTENFKTFFYPKLLNCINGIVVSIVAFQTVGPGSNPDQNNFYKQLK